MIKIINIQGWDRGGNMDIGRGNRFIEVRVESWSITWCNSRVIIISIRTTLRDTFIL